MINHFSFKAFILLAILQSSPALLSKVDFVHQIMPVLKKNCAECHTEGKKKGGLSMNTLSEFLTGGEGGEVAVPGEPDESYFLELGTQGFSSYRIVISRGFPYSYDWVLVRLPGSSLGFGYIHRTHSNHRFLRVKTELVLKCTDQRQF